MSRPSEYVPKQNDQAQAWEDVAQHNPLEGVWAILWSVERVELNHHARQVLAYGFDQHHERKQCHTASPQVGQNTLAVAVRRRVHHQRHLGQADAKQGGGTCVSVI
jgi:hypothetical protein